ncbi:MAG: phosphatase PAP2 family protein, partial [Planctomycetes bacterium]|nr:phosphatase PAP2 family protein [Planctomycetota bacterium]
PIFTDVLQLAYATYYAMPIAVLAGARGASRRSKVAAILLAGFLISYLLYFAVPGRGPHIYHGLALPRGTGIAEAVRTAILRLEGTMWDAFPSGHTLIAVLSLILGFRERTWLGVVLAPCVLLLVLSTVLLRYHYVIDVAAGLVLVPCSLGLGTLAFRRLEPPGVGAAPGPDV